MSQRRISSELEFGLERLEERKMLAGDAGFNSIAGNLVFEITGTGEADSIVLTTDDDGDVAFVHEIDGVLEQSGDVEADDIALAELITGLSFEGFVVRGAGGDDVIDMSGVTNYNTGGSGGNGDDLIIGGAQEDLLIGGAGMDTILGGDSNDLILGGADMDFLYGEKGDDVVLGNSGDDSLSGGEGDDDLFGGTGFDLLVGDLGADELFGGSENDRLLADSDDTALKGGSGFGDQLLMDSATTAGLNLVNTDIEFIDTATGYTADIATKTLTAVGDLDFADNVNSKPYAGGAFGVSVTTGLGDDVLIGSAFNDRLLAGDGDDLVNGGPGADFMDGGPGDDTLSYQGAAAGVGVDMKAGLGFAGDATGDVIVIESFETLIGTGFSDTLLCDNADKTILGLGGNDWIEGRAGNDSLFGGNGNDSLFGQNGDDSLFGENGSDFLNGGRGGADQSSGGAGKDRLVFFYVGGADVIDDAFVFGGSGDDVFEVRDLADPVNEFAVRSELSNLAAYDFDANGDDELELVL